MFGLRQKADDATALHAATLGGVRGPLWTPDTVKRVPAEQLVKRYGRWVHRCISINAQAAAAVEPRLFTVDSGGVIEKCSAIKTRKLTQRDKAFCRGQFDLRPGDEAKGRIRGNVDDLVEITEHPILTLLNDVNPWDEGYGFREGMYSDLQAFGRYFCQMIGTDGGGPPTELWRMLPQKTVILKDPVEFIKGYKYGTGPTEHIYQPHEVLWFHLFDPSDPWGGLGPLEAWLKTIDGDFAIAAYQEWIFNRGGTPDTVIVSKSTMGDDAKRSFRKMWRSMFGTLFARQESVAIVEGDVEIKQLGNKPREMEFVKGKEVSRDEIGQAFGVPKALLTSDDVNLSNAKEGSITHMRNTVWPMVRRVEDRENQAFVPLWSDRMFIIHENPIQEDRVIRITERPSQLAAGYSVNEIRAQDGAEAIDDPMADEPMMSPGLVPLSSVLAGGAVAPDGATEPLEGEEVPLEGELQTTQATVLTGAQIVAATAIIQGVADSTLPVESARGQLQVMFNLSPEQADMMLAGVEGFEPEKPAMPMMVPGQSPVVPDEDEPEEGDDEKSISKHVHGCNHKADKQGVFKQSTAWTAKQDGPILGAGARGYPKFEASLSRVFHRQAGEVILALRVGKAAKEQVPLTAETYLPADIATWQAEIAAAADPFIAQGVSLAGRASIVNLGARVGAGVSFDMQNTRVVDYVQLASTRVGGQTAATWEAELKRELVAGIEAGESVKQIAGRIQQLSKDTVPWKAEQIARTEMAFAASAGKELGWQQSGVVSGKRFICAPDCCPFCQSIEAQYGGDSVPTSLGTPYKQIGEDIVLPPVGDSIHPRVMKMDYADLTDAPVHPHCRCPGSTPILIEE